ncbi:MAG: DAK2 domain-containing protein [Actinobacteria bacterium]|nr:DAK2 domain-containing protein [Actinomycetota bacterium]
MVIKLNDKEVKKVIDIIILNFKENEGKINTLNVFPVPDGDTGTNMLLTLKSIQQEINNTDDFTMQNLAEKISFSALMGARGNSGVILSQILKGFLDKIKDTEGLDFQELRNALKSSMELAYSSVQNPTEGTMLTTIKDIYQTVDNLNINSLQYMELLDLMINETEKSVLRTTFLLPVLKQAGVVDAGAQGILEILIGLKKAIMYLKNNNTNDKKTKKNADKGEIKEQKGLRQINLKSDIKFIYCTELIIKGENINLIRLREDIESLGDSGLVVGNDRLVKIHIHTNYPQKVLRRTLREGTLHEIQINNMVDQSKQAMVPEEAEGIGAPVKDVGLIAIANGDGFEEIFKSVGVDIVIKGGQSMNPSTYEIVKAINKLKSEKIILFPNNKNIILTANQAKKIVKKSVTVIPTISIPQGISAALIYNSDLTLEENVNNMEKTINNIKTGEITNAVRDANLFVGEIKKGAFIGLSNGKVKVVSDTLIDAVIELAREMVDGSEEILTFYYGEGISTDENKELGSLLKNYFPKIEIEFHKGGQPLYPYIFSIE